MLLICRFKNSKEIKSNTRCVLSVDKDVVTLTFKDTELNDAGTYKCEASNKLGTVNTECTVEVQSTLAFSITAQHFLFPLSTPFKIWLRTANTTALQRLGSLHIVHFFIWMICVSNVSICEYFIDKSINADFPFSCTCAYTCISLAKSEHTINRQS